LVNSNKWKKREEECPTSQSSAHIPVRHFGGGEKEIDMSQLKWNKEEEPNAPTRRKLIAERRRKERN